MPGTERPIGGSGLSPCLEGMPHLCVGEQRSSRHTCTNPGSTRPGAAVVHSAVGTQRREWLWSRRASQQVRDLALEPWKNYFSCNVCSARMIHRAQKGTEHLTVGKVSKRHSGRGEK